MGYAPLSSSLSGWTLRTAQHISDTGWITGSGLYDPDGLGGLAQYPRHFLLQLPPVPEPTSLALILLAGLAISMLRTRDTRRR